MKIVIAPDSFKNSLTAKQIADAIETGFKQARPDDEYLKVPMADGGEGTVQSLVDSTDGKLVTLEVTGPLGTPVTATYGLINDSKTAVIEMSAASGIHFVDEKTKNPYITTTFGTGELIKNAIQKGVTEIILGIGGSATNDGGAGMAQALGYRLLNANNEELPFGGRALSNLDHIDTQQVIAGIMNTKILIASDVTNPLTGAKGASAVFGPQKGANEEMVGVLDNSLHHYAEVIKNNLGKDVENKPGSGAAGGLGAGLLAFTNSTMQSGIDLVIKYTNLKEKLVDADIVVTGEGSIDFQTQYGKTPMGVTLVAKEVSPNSKVVVIAGSIGKDIDILYEKGMDSIFSCVPGIETLEQALIDAEYNVQRIAENIARLV